jgi:hypothetical protein
MKRLLAISLLFLTAVSARATCDVTASSASYVDVSTAVSSATSGQTVCIPAGSATLTDGQYITMPPGVTIQGAGANVSGTIWTKDSSFRETLFVTEDTGSGDRRITGIWMKSATITNGSAKKGVGVEIRGYSNKTRVDHCRFDDLYCGVWTKSSHGVTDHNSYYNVHVPYRHSGQGLLPFTAAWANLRNCNPDYGVVSPNVYPPQHVCTTNAPFNSTDYVMFHEDETIELTGDSTVTDELDAVSWVIRYCNVALKAAHGPYDGAQSFPLFDVHGDTPNSITNAGNPSAIVTLLYENTITVEDGSNMDFLALRGGQALVFNNNITKTGSSGASVTLRDERVEFGCSDCVPIVDPLRPGVGSWPKWGDAQYEDTIHNTYVWNDKLNGVVAQQIYVDPYANTLPTIVVGVNPAADPTANAWTSEPASLSSLLPTYPHPLIGATPAPTPTPSPTVTPTPTPTATPTPSPSVSVSVPTLIRQNKSIPITVTGVASATATILRCNPQGSGCVVVKTITLNCVSLVCTGEYRTTHEDSVKDEDGEQKYRLKVRANY